MNTTKAGWGCDRISFTPSEVEKIRLLMEENGGSVYDTLKEAMKWGDSSKEEMLRLVYIIENRERLSKTCGEIKRGVCYESFVSMTP